MKTVTVSFDEPTLQALLGLIDAGVRATGLQSAHAAAKIDALLGEAIRAAQEPATPAEPPATDADVVAAVKKAAGHE